MLRFLAAAPLVLVFTVAPGTATAQSNCGYAQFCGDAHRFDPTPPNSENAHVQCWYCYFEQTYPVCHPVCNITLADPVLKEHFEAAAETGDVRSILDLAADVPGFVMWNAERQAIQIKSCSLASLIASLPVHDPLIVAMSQKLPSVEVAMGGSRAPFPVRR